MVGVKSHPDACLPGVLSSSRIRRWLVLIVRCRRLNMGSECGLRYM